MSSNAGNSESPGSQPIRGILKPPRASTPASGIPRPSSRSQSKSPSAPAQQTTETTISTKRTRNKTPNWFTSPPASAHGPEDTTTHPTDPQMKSKPWVSHATKKFGFSRGAPKSSQLKLSHPKLIHRRGDNMNEAEPPVPSVCFTIMIDLTTTNKL